MLKMKRCFALVLLALSLMLLTIACGTEQEAFQLVVCGPYLDEAAVTEYGDTLVPEDSSWEEEQNLSFEVMALSMGSEKLDPMIYSTSVMKLTVMSAAGDIDLWISDLENAASFGRNGAFCDLSQLCTEEELAPYTQRLITFQLTDEEGNLLEEETPPCGIELTSMEQFSDIYGDKPCGVFISSTSFHTETAKEALLSIAAGEAL